MLTNVMAYIIVDYFDTILHIKLQNNPERNGYRNKPGFMKYHFHFTEWLQCKKYAITLELSHYTTSQ